MIRNFRDFKLKYWVICFSTSTLKINFEVNFLWITLLYSGGKQNAWSPIVSWVHIGTSAELSLAISTSRIITRSNFIISFTVIKNVFGNGNILLSNFFIYFQILIHNHLSLCFLLNHPQNMYSHKMVQVNGVFSNVVYW